MDRKQIVVSLLCLAVLGGLLAGCGKRQKDQAARAAQNSIFSWEDDYMMPEYEDQISQAFDRLGCKAVYQAVPEDAEEEMVLDYLDRRSRKGQDVYYLTGAPAWGVEKGAEAMLHEVDMVCAWNKKAAQDGYFAGIVWDVEPYLLEAWEQEPEAVMDQFVENCSLAYERAGDQGLVVIVCIPNFYDKKGFGDQVEALVKNGCDAVAVMNYNKDGETRHIEEETELARTYGKGILNIAELQRPGTHDLTENNTYYSDGIKAVEQSFQKLEQELDYSRLGFSWHYMKPVLELLEREEER